MELATRVDLDGTWRLSWKAIEGCEGVPECASAIDGAVPGDVHQDLVNAGLLPEPLVGVNAPKHEWVERAVFTYERDVAVEQDFDRAELVFNGLDCLAEVRVDSAKVGSSANAFVEHTFDVTSQLQRGKQHKLSVDIDSGVQWAKDQDASPYKTHEAAERLFLRKPQFAFKWDWAPRLVTCGMWRSAELRLLERGVIRDVALTPTLTGNDAVLSAAVELEAFAEGDFVLRLRATRGPMVWQSVSRVTLQPGANRSQVSVNVEQVERWFPAGYGDQALYCIDVELEHDGRVVDSRSFTYGFREVSIKQSLVKPGESTFIVNVNGIDVFCKGANWVPADSIVARVSDEKYEALVKEAAAANFNMFRIWGGGIYESDTFYDLCDRYGILIWHDFMFACSEYPDDQQWFMDNVRDEARKTVKRLRHHACIALWCGNNENDWIFGFMIRGESKKLVPFPGRAIYHDLLPEVCRELDPQRFYWPSSPYGGDDPNGEAVGDRHAWNVSILNADVAVRADVRNYRKERGKFNSEFGVISHALPRTILDYTQEAVVDMSSEAYRFHDNPVNQRQPDGQSFTDWQLETFVGRVLTDPIEYVNYSMAYQAVGYREAISDFRILKPNCAGSLFWMYSDCWGTLGWTIVDYYLRRKPSFYWVRKAYAPVAVFVRVEGDSAHSYLVNDTTKEIDLLLTMETGDLVGNRNELQKRIVVPANGVINGPALECGSGYALAEVALDGVVVSDDLILSRFPAEMDVPEVSISCKSREVDGELELTVSSDGFGHFVSLDLPDGAVPSDNYFNLLARRPRVVRVKGAGADEVRVGALNLRAKG